MMLLLFPGESRGPARTSAKLALGILGPGFRRGTGKKAGAGSDFR